MKRRPCSKCGRNRAERFFSGPRGRVCSSCRRKRVASTGKDARLQATYGITLEEWEAILDSQGGVCGICGGTRTMYDTDHDHQVEKLLRSQGISDLEATRMSVRGLLCKTCNRRLLPAAKDDPERLQAAIRYLESPPASAIILDSLA